MRPAVWGGLVCCAVMAAVAGWWSGAVPFAPSHTMVPSGGPISPLPCGTSRRWAEVVVELYGKALAGAVEDFKPILIGWDTNTNHGIGNRHRALERAFISSILMNRPCLARMFGDVDNNKLWIPKSVLPNISEIVTETVTPPARYNSEVLKFIRDKLGKERPTKNWGRMFGNKSVSIRSHLPLIKLEKDVLQPVRRFWGKGEMPENVKLLHHSILNMTVDTRPGCVWHFLYRMSDELSAEVSKALFEVAQKSNLLPQNTSLKAELDDGARADFFQNRYGNLWMPRATMKEAMTKLFRRIDGGAIPIYVSVQYRGGGELGWKKERRRTTEEVAASMVPCAVAFSETDYVKVLVASDRADFKVSVSQEFPKEVITLSIADTPLHVAFGGPEAYVQAYVEAVVLSLADKFVGSRSCFAFAAANLGYIDRHHFIMARGVSHRTSERWFAAPQPQYTECGQNYRVLPPRPEVQWR